MSSGRLDHTHEGTSPTDGKPQVVHGSFALQVGFSAPPEQVFAAFAEPALRIRWFRLPGSSKHATHALDFRVGGSEVATNLFVSGDIEERLEYRSRFHDIVPGERIVYVYEAHVDGLRRWVSLVTLELVAQGAGSRLDWTEQYAYLVLSGDGTQDTAHLQGGTRLMLNGLSAVVDPERYRGLAKIRPEES
ncbi:SRPBCC domain-containing protein [Kitasatospora sp. NBC_01246]|uniref:SRPBCC domain-containing protein n=1 Tax=Kitasatospora sp. NBC_01246 TaxID=2903570 RepID=UPI002E304C8F|nr:SRPBCC domain-containing protein [Kitasatospora sp. NBC_01246]